MDNGIDMRPSMGTPVIERRQWFIISWHNHLFIIIKDQIENLIFKMKYANKLW